MRCCMIIFTILCSSGCLMEAVTVTAIQGEMAAQNAQAGSQALAKAKDTKSKIELESAINTYAGLNGFYPSSLHALEPSYFPAVPTRSNGNSFGYDSKTGKVTILPWDQNQPESTRTEMTQADVNNLSQLRGAVYRYWEMTGYYPQSLESLSPLYITKIPTMSTGGAFPYNKRTGLVSHPGERGATQNIGAGQSAGTRSAGGQANGIAGTHTQKQLKVLDDLGF
ncbi:MAG: hypothetical protein VCC01_15010 [Candidatus Hydrogenedentota bacterium]